MYYVAVWDGDMPNLSMPFEDLYDATQAALSERLMAPEDTRIEILEDLGISPGA